MKQVTRRSVLKGLTLGSVGVVLAGCTPRATPTSPSGAVVGKATTAPPAAPRVSGKLILMHGFGTAAGPEYNWINQWVDTFRKQHAEVQIETTGVPLGELETKLVAAVAAGTPPDLGANLARGTEPSRAIMKQIQPLSEYMTRDNMRAADLFYKSTIEECTWEGKQYGLPFNGTVTLHYWNKDLFKQAGLDPEKPAANWDELWEYANKLDVKGANGKYTRFGFYPLVVFVWFLADAWSNGAEFVVGEGSERKPNLANPEAIEALEYWVRYAKKYTVEGWTEFASGLGTQDVFVTQKLAMINNGIQWFRKVYALSADLKFGASVLPYKKKPAAFTAGGALEIPVGAKNREGGWELAKFLLQPECQSVQLSDFSAVPGTITGFEMGQQRSPDPNWKAVNEAMKVSRYVQFIQGIANWRSIVEGHVKAAMQLKETPEEALKKAQAEAEQELANYKRTQG